MQSTLDEIAQLQQTENRLYQALTNNTERKLLGEPTFTDSEVADITAQINSLSAARVNLYNSLSETYKSQATNEKNASDILAQQTQTLKLLESQLNQSKMKLTTLKEERSNQLKMVEITTYYSKQYDAYRRLMRMIAIVGFCLLVAIGLKYTPLSVASKPLSILVIVVGSVFIGGRLINMFMRREDNYDEFVWPMAPTNKNQLEHGMGSPLGITGLGIPYICNSESCCGKGTIWSDKGCVVKE